MRSPIFAFALLCVVAAQSPTGKQLLADQDVKQVPLDPKAGTYDLAPYRYVLTHVVNNNGVVTKVGLLYRDNIPIAGNDFYRLELPIGSFIWHPPQKSLHSSIHQLGWIRINPGKKYSRWSMALIEPNLQPNSKFLRTVMRNPTPFAEITEEPESEQAVPQTVQ